MSGLVISKSWHSMAGISDVKAIEAAPNPANEGILRRFIMESDASVSLVCCIVELATYPVPPMLLQK